MSSETPMTSPAQEGAQQEAERIAKLTVEDQEHGRCLCCAPQKAEWNCRQSWMRAIRSALLQFDTRPRPVEPLSAAPMTPTEWVESAKVIYSNLETKRSWVHREAAIEELAKALDATFLKGATEQREADAKMLDALYQNWSSRSYPPPSWVSQMAEKIRLAPLVEPPK